MKTTESQAIKIAKKVLKDIEFWDDDIESPIARYDPGKEIQIGTNIWLIGFGYGAKDFGQDANGRSRANVMVTINDETGTALDVISKGGYMLLAYNNDENKYSVKS